MHLVWRHNARVEKNFLIPDSTREEDANQDSKVLLRHYIKVQCTTIVEDPILEHQFFTLRTLTTSTQAHLDSLHVMPSCIATVNGHISHSGSLTDLYSVMPSHGVTFLNHLDSCLYVFISFQRNSFTYLRSNTSLFFPLVLSTTDNGLQITGCCSAVTVQPASVNSCNALSTKLSVLLVRLKRDS